MHLYIAPMQNKQITKSLALLVRRVLSTAGGLPRPDRSRRGIDPGAPATGDATARKHGGISKLMKILKC